MKVRRASRGAASSTRVAGNTHRPARRRHRSFLRPPSRVQSRMGFSPRATCWLGGGDEGLGYLCDVLERGVMEKLEKLGLSGNKIGSEGLVRLGDVLAKGGAAALKEVGLEGNPAGEATVQALQGALRDRATFAAVQNVYLPRLR